MRRWEGCAAAAPAAGLCCCCCGQCCCWCCNSWSIRLSSSMPSIAQSPAGSGLTQPSLPPAPKLNRRTGASPDTFCTAQHTGSRTRRQLGRVAVKVSVCLQGWPGSQDADQQAATATRGGGWHSTAGVLSGACVHAAVLCAGQYSRSFFQTHPSWLRPMCPGGLQQSTHQTHIVEVAGSAPLPGCWGAGSADWTAEGHQGDFGRALCIARAVGWLQAQRQRHRRVQGQSSQLASRQVSGRAPKGPGACGTTRLHDRHVFYASAAPAATHWRPP